MKKSVIIITGIVLLCSVITTCSLLKLEKDKEYLNDKVKYYENVITDFGIEEFIHYPELYYEEGYIEQVKAHECMWSIDETISCENELYDLKRECGIEEE